ncbi:RHS repeat-associated core domain-containing protein [Pseudomonas vlassakiae]|uniref:RHS repeat-associated core domain-containing protein n=1 Tax=Pseudomonas vlassakiae TaxID=485888 RepID=A0A923GLM3_9PSED|nr:RHS repeat-associated core domain-containing protein [Pseudomonas vlassakiae]
MAGQDVAAGSRAKRPEQVESDLAQARMADILASRHSKKTVLLTTLTLPALAIKDGAVMRSTTTDITSSDNKPSPVFYNAYGHTNGTQTSIAHLFYNGEFFHEHFYLLGLGYRAYSPTLMRFYACDEHSPFGSGGINSYAYCSGDPINFSDPDGRWPQNPRVAHTTKSKLVKIHRPTPSVNLAAAPQQQQPGPSRPAGNLHREHGRPPRISDGFQKRWRVKHPQPLSSQTRQSYANRTGRLPESLDPLGYSRGTPRINSSETAVLHSWNTTNTRKFQYLDLKWSRVARFSVIEDRLAGLNPMDKLRRAFPKMPNRYLGNIIYSVDRYIAELRDPMKNTH